IGAGVGLVAGAGGIYLAGGITATFSKFTTDLVACSMFGTPIGTWEDYAIAFIAGGVTAGRGLWVKAGVDIVGRPLATQLVKMGTGRQNEFQLDKFGYDIATRVLTFGIPSPWRSFSRGITRGYWDLWKRDLLDQPSQQFHYAY
nr:hypothetical protein [Bacilli bacterium]